MNELKIRNTKHRSYMRTSTTYKIGMSINYFLLALLGVATLYPFWYCIILAFNEGKDALAGGVYFLPRAFTLENFIKAFENPYIFNAFGISIARTVLSIIFGCFLTGIM